MAARVLLIEDDPSIARFVELALEELPGHDAAAPPVQLQQAASVAQAREALAGGGWQLVISDLMLPDGSAETLLAEGFALGAGAPAWLVFSAGVHDDRHLALAARGVARTLRKPVPLLELLDTVAELLRRPAASAAPAAADGHDDDGGDPVQRHFGGDRALFETFRDGCIQRFADDLAQGDAALAAGDTAALRRVAHGLKAVLALIGQARLAASARALEDAAASGVNPAGHAADWAQLAQGLVALGARRTAPH
jgi:CheY-like chemotaxis protein